jgi:hypothetical protein
MYEGFSPGPVGIFLLALFTHLGWPFFPLWSELASDPAEVHCHTAGRAAVRQTGQGPPGKDRRGWGGWGGWGGGGWPPTVTSVWKRRSRLR